MQPIHYYENDAFAINEKLNDLSKADSKYISKLMTTQTCNNRLYCKKSFRLFLRFTKICKNSILNRLP